MFETTRAWIPSKNSLLHPPRSSWKLLAVANAATSGRLMKIIKGSHGSSGCLLETRCLRDQRDTGATTHEKWPPGQAKHGENRHPLVYVRAWARRNLRLTRWITSPLLWPAEFDKMVQQLRAFCVDPNLCVTAQKSQNHIMLVPPKHAVESVWAIVSPFQRAPIRWSCPFLPHHHAPTSAKSEVISSSMYPPGLIRIRLQTGKCEGGSTHLHTTVEMCQNLLTTTQKEAVQCVFWRSRGFFFCRRTN